MNKDFDIVLKNGNTLSGTIAEDNLHELEHVFGGNAITEIHMVDGTARILTSTIVAITVWNYEDKPKIGPR